MLALLVLHRAKLLASNQSILALGVAPMRVVSRTKSVQDAPTTNDHSCTDAEPTKHTQPFTGKGGFGKDAEIRTHQALHEAKPTECPKGDRD